MGCKRDHRFPKTFRKGSTVFDLHTHILWADRIKSRTLLLTKNQDHIYRETLPVNYEGQEARCLHPYDQILYLCIHALKHRVDRLILMVDIQRLLLQLGSSRWSALLDRAKDLGQEKSLVYILTLIHQLPELHLPEQASQIMKRKPLHFLENRALKRRVRDVSLPLWTPFILFSPEKGLRKRFSYVLETVFPRPEVLRQIDLNSPDSKVWRLYWKRSLQLLSKAKTSLIGV